MRALGQGTLSHCTPSLLRQAMGTSSLLTLLALHSKLGFFISAGEVSVKITAAVHFFLGLDLNLEGGFRFWSVQRAAICTASCACRPQAMNLHCVATTRGFFTLVLSFDWCSCISGSLMIVECRFLRDHYEELVRVSETQRDQQINCLCAD